jgi:RNA polymerase sigma factor (sigma-70 family)
MQRQDVASCCLMTQSRVGWPESRALACLVRAAQRGNLAEVDALLAALRPPLLTFFANRVEPDAAEDLAQCALVRIAGALRRIDPERADAYVSTVARNLLRTAYRRRLIDRRRHAEVELDTIPEWRESSEVRQEYEELVRSVHRIAELELPAPLAEIVRGLLRGETPSEISQRQAVSPVTIRTRLLRARAILRRELRGHLDSPDADEARTTRRRSTPV